METLAIGYQNRKKMKMEIENRGTKKLIRVFLSVFSLEEFCREEGFYIGKQIEWRS